MKKVNKYFYLIVVLFLISTSLKSQEVIIPSSHSNIYFDKRGKLYYEKDNHRIYADTPEVIYSLSQVLGKATGTDDGVVLDFKDFKGTICYGLIPYGKAAHPLPVFRYTVPIIEGKVLIDIKTSFRYPYDIVGWQENKPFTVGYRLADTSGDIIFDGEISLKGTGPFKILPTIYEGPFVSNVTESGATIWFNTSLPVKTSVNVNNMIFEDKQSSTHHEIKITGLEADTKYDYTVVAGDLKQSYFFKTFPENGSRKPFIFAYTSDSRHGHGGGERKIYGANANILKKMAALVIQQDAEFVQFTGDMINGYLTNKEEIILQYTNWKKAIEPFWHYIPFYVGQGNHESLGYIFRDPSNRKIVTIDKFPYATESSESALKEAFVNPENGPVSEDNNKYDINPNQRDFPSYNENVYFYTYDNVAMVVLNSNYWFAPRLNNEPVISGGLHGYIMDNQLQWLEKTIQQLENDKNIDHVFVTQHTPAFPNGGHSKDDMWYSGNNENRPFISGKPVAKGIIERRDEYLDILINQSTKVVAILTGDEHNYNRLKLTKDVTIYPPDYPHKKLNVSRSIYQINNGACGAPYYSQEKLPWSEHTKAFSVENAVCFFYVDGDKIKMKVINPDTLNEIDEIELKK